MMHSALLSPSTHAFANAACTALIGSIWQGVLLVAALSVVLRLFRGLTASARAAIWMATLLVVVSLPAVLLLLPHHGHAAGTAIHVSEGWSFALLAVWLTLSMIRAFGLLRSAFQLRRIAQRAVAVCPDPAVAALLGSSSREVQLCTSRAVQRPCVAGFFRPRILIPASLLRSLSAAELEQVVRHEMEHLRRRDDWTNLLQQASLVLCPLNPAVGWVDRRLAAERELACDDAVLRATNARKAYAACLAHIAEHALMSRPMALALALVGRRGRQSEISRRVERILSAPERAMSGLQLRLTLGVLLAGGVAAVAVIARSPELVSFSPASTTLASPVLAASASVPAIGNARWSTAQAAPMPHAQMVKAVMPSAAPVNSQTRLIRARTVVGGRAPRRVPMSNATADTAPIVVLTQWRSMQQPMRQTLTTFQIPQASYAAIRFADGWLIVQL
jgi:beta-lactamase regulating signal transducer with metallopeptidase domain